MIAMFKALHIAALSVWCAGLILLPVIIQTYRHAHASRNQAGFSEFRWLTHYSYQLVLTPAAVIAVIAGTVLIFAQEVLDTWLLVKLVAVSGMVLVHAWLGHVVVQAGERREAYRLPPAAFALVALLPLMGLVLWLVLAKPALDDLIALFPEFLREPRGNAIPARFDPL
ncbi:CopD family protein [Roseinatronobacter alkalisoli]|uniref:Protoporphyrinogen IX oxidase n=1 Tax=Roseinatronobacter alkalisoli TaxID=3028235 RepID=A0ABT5T8A3_9RHOB|nr:CopD family protein [Roseinatronobacter sp. HJB301]MDD7971354.1 CopD family protein [Roseinatronobacter sp. HJB301]